MKKYFDYVKGKVGYIWFRVKTGQEPILVRAFVALVVAVAAMFGQILDPSMVLAVVIFLVPAAVSARGQVSPSENSYSWLDRLKELFTKPDIKTTTEGPVAPGAVEPGWVEEFQELGDA